MQVNRRISTDAVEGSRSVITISESMACEGTPPDAFDHPLR